MSSDPDIFDAPNVRVHVRKRLHHLYIIILSILGLTLLGLGLARSGHLPPRLLIGLVIGGWGLGVWGLSWQLRRLRRKVWCLKLTTDRITGFDFARHQTVIDWTKVHRIDLRDDALVVVKSPYCFLDISASFPAFPALSHRIVELADRHRVPVYIDGRPWSQVDIYTLFPFLTKEPPTDASGLNA